MLSVLESSLFASIGGLPVHPLVVHFAVVLLPLAALGLIVLVVVPRWAARYGWLVLAGLAAGTGAAFVAKESGEQLAREVGDPVTHAAWGDRLPVLSVALLVVAVGWLVLQRRAASAGRPRSLASGIAGGVAAALAVAVTALTVVVGHSGAQAAWGDRVDAGAADAVAQAAASPVASPSPTTASPSATAAAAATPASPGATTASAYTLADVAQHADASSCWSVVNRQVYDLTDWIRKHPGGASRILGMCGKDATAAFTTQHAGQTKPERLLAGFRIGALAG